MNILRREPQPLVCPPAPEVAGVVMRALAKPPESRLADAEAFADALRAAAAADGIGESADEVTPIASVASVAPRRPRRGWLGALVGGLLLSATVAAVWTLTSSDVSAPERSRETLVALADPPRATTDPSPEEPPEPAPIEPSSDEPPPSMATRTTTRTAPAPLRTATRPPPASPGMVDGPARREPSAEVVSDVPGRPRMVRVQCRAGGTSTQPSLRRGEYVKVESVRPVRASGHWHVPATLPRQVSRCYRHAPIGGWEWRVEVEENGGVARADPVRHCVTDPAVVACVRRVIQRTNFGAVRVPGQLMLAFSWTSSAPGPYGSPPSPRLRTEW